MVCFTGKNTHPAPHRGPGLSPGWMGAEKLTAGKAHSLHSGFPGTTPTPSPPKVLSGSLVKLSQSPEPFLRRVDGGAESLAGFQTTWSSPSTVRKPGATMITQIPLPCPLPGGRELPCSFQLEKLLLCPICLALSLLFWPGDGAK